jgi:hypothetical protein
LVIPTAQVHGRPPSPQDEPAWARQAEFVICEQTIERSLAWVLDVGFNEDASRVRERTAARNFALLRKIALNLVARDRSRRASLRGRRKMAAWNDVYMLRIIAGQAHA